jgi:hypothetical protein
MFCINLMKFVWRIKKPNFFSYILYQMSWLLSNLGCALIFILSASILFLLRLYFYNKELEELWNSKIMLKFSFLNIWWLVNKFVCVCTNIFIMFVWHCIIDGCCLWFKILKNGIIQSMLHPKLGNLITDAIVFSWDCHNA